LLEVLEGDHNHEGLDQPIVDVVVIVEVIGDVVAEVLKVLAEGNGSSILHYDRLCFFKLVILRVLTQSLGFFTFLLWFSG